MKPLVYDVGMNQGRNIPYYLKKGCRVVAIEAAPDLAHQAEERFADAVAAGDLTVVNVGISNAEGSAIFHVNTVDTVHSSLLPPLDPGPEWKAVRVPTKRLSTLLREHGDPHFVKIDIEGADLTALKDLLVSEMRPPLISVEAHTIGVVCALVTMGYEQLQFVNGREIGRSIAHREITALDGSKLSYLFPRHSAGPFGDDLEGPWLPPEAAMLRWTERRTYYGRGWLDVHGRAT